MNMEREAVTIRFPISLLSKAKHLKDGSESFNELVVEAVEREVKRRQAIVTHQSIVARRAKIKARTGVHPDVNVFIHSLREGDMRSE
ncbi:conserved hypothetical protein (plasmid) [Nostoc punctiforme PCC 73102]|uniref:Uncharacterized protein n=2 Tax=Nostoc punctiforme TaxID=272131 RepID=B2JB91_NOSP7|nr:conserved hypothetical protein [Nostoc punctiforme PCC 73102]